MKMYKDVLPMTGGATVSVIGVTMDSNNIVAIGLLVFIAGLVAFKLVRYKSKDGLN